MAIFSYYTPPSYFFLNYSIKKIVSTSNKYQLQLVLQIFEKDLQLNIRKTIQFYNVLHITLSIRINGISTYVNTIANLRKLIALKKEVVVREVFNLDSRRFPFRIYNIED